MEHDTLKQILESTQKEAKFSRLLAILMAGVLAVMIIAAVILVPRLIATLTYINDVAQDAQVIIERANTTLDELSVAFEGVDTMTKSITDTSGALFDGLSSVDFAALSEAIADLKDAIEPLANFSRALSGR